MSTDPSRINPSRIPSPDSPQVEKPGENPIGTRRQQLPIAGPGRPDSRCVEEVEGDGVALTSDELDFPEGAKVYG